MSVESVGIHARFTSTMIVYHVLATHARFTITRVMRLGLAC